MTLGPADVVVVVPSIAVDDLVLRCVETCRRDAPGVPVIVVVDDPAAADRLEGLATVVPARSASIAAKRNQGVEASDSRHVAFIDSDAYPAPGWLDAAVALLDVESGLGAVGGPNVSPPDQPPWDAAVGRAHLSFLVDGWWRFRKRATAHARDVSALPSCNLVVRRSDYQSVGGMDERLFTAEDTDFCSRLVRAGRHIRFTPEVMVFHKDRGLRGFVIQRYTFGVAMVPLLRRGSRPDLAYLSISGALCGFVLFLSSWPLALVSRRWARIWLSVTALYGTTILAEALRLAGCSRSTARVACTLTVGNLAPGVGVITRALRLAPDLRGVYRNDR